MFAPLRDDVIFRKCLTVLNDTVVWDLDRNRNPAACIDLDPCELYESCPVVEAPPQRGDLTAALAYQKTSQHQTSTALFGTCGENWVTPALLRSRLRSPTSTPKPRAEGRVRAGGTQATSRPERERRPSPSAPAKNREASTMLASLFFVSAHKDSATRHGCAPRSACRGASACQWHANYEPTEAAGETSPSLHLHQAEEEPPSLSLL